MVRRLPEAGTAPGKSISELPGEKKKEGNALQTGVSRKKPDPRAAAGYLDEAHRLLVGTISGFFRAGHIILFLKQPVTGFIADFVLLKPTDVVNVYFKGALYCGAGR
jgi:hypothetical protein